MAKKKLNMEHENLNTEETTNSDLGAVSGCSSSNNISKVYLLDPKDCVFENGVFVRIKRKYGKFKRFVHVFDYNNR